MYKCIQQLVFGNSHDKLQDRFSNTKISPYPLKDACKIAVRASLDGTWSHPFPVWGIIESMKPTDAQESMSSKVHLKGPGVYYCPTASGEVSI